MWLNIWRAVVQIFYVAVVLLVFGQLHGRLEKITVALCGVLYVTVRSAAIGQAIFQREVIIGIQREFDAIKAATIPGFEPTRTSVLQDMMAKANQQVWFEYGGLTIIFVVCLINTFIALGS